MATRTPNSFLVFCGSLLALLIVACLFVFSIARGPRPSDLENKRAQNRIAVRAKLEQEANDALTTDGWVDKAKGLVRVPVASVFAATAKELAAKKPAPSQVKVEPPLPMPVIDPNATEPPPPALPSAPQGADTVRFAALNSQAAPASIPPVPAASGPVAAPQTPAPAAPATQAVPPTAPAPQTTPAAPVPSTTTPRPAPPAPAVPPAQPATPPPAPGAPQTPPPAPPTAALSTRPPLINWPDTK
jgi:hypothetical protein